LYLHELEVHEFFYYQLWRKELSKDRYKSFIGWKKHINILIKLNPLQYRCLTENKLIFYTYCKNFKLATPEIYAIYDPNLPEIENFSVLRNVDQLIDFVIESNISEFVIKPTEGTKGQSFRVLRFDKKESEFYSVLGQRIHKDTVSQLLKGYNYRNTAQTNFLIQERLHPCSATLALSPYVPFSMRFLTLLDHTYTPHIIEAYGKSAVGENETDNRASGGLLIRMDRKGICLGVNSRDSRSGVSEKHPLNNFIFKDWQVPLFHEAWDLALKSARAFYMVRCVAWDIIVSEKGARVIEGNNPWNVLQQDAYDRGLWQGVFAAESEVALKKVSVASPWW
jgi:hypothetical protein